MNKLSYLKNTITLVVNKEKQILKQNFTQNFCRQFQKKNPMKINLKYNKIYC